MVKLNKKSGPKILIVDIETAPIKASVWDLFDQNIGLNQIIEDWHLLSWAAKWHGDAPNKVMYQDQSKIKDKTNDKKMLEGIWKLLDEADIVLGQNSKRFDVKKLNARFALHGMKPPSSFNQIDTLQLARKHFAFTSNKLEYLAYNLNVKYKKLDHKKYPGHSMWNECLAGNQDAWKEMKKYNIHDVLATEELYDILVVWDTRTNLDAYTEDLGHTCTCGNKTFRNKGYKYLSSGKYHRYQCLKCGKESRGQENLLSKEKRKSMRR